MSQSNKSAAYKFTMNLKPIQIILPISIFSFLFSQSPVFDGLLNLLETCSFDSTYTLSIRTYAFLLFNGLLVLLIKNSGTSKRVPDSSNSSPKTATETTVFDVEEEDDEVLAGDHEEKDKDGGCYDTGRDFLADEEEEEDNEGILANGEVDEGHDILADEEENDQDEIVAVEEEDEDDFLADDDEEDQEEFFEWGISVEELNSKCDDFIKNMRHML